MEKPKALSGFTPTPEQIRREENRRLDSRGQDVHENGMLLLWDFMAAVEFGFAPSTMTMELMAASFRRILQEGTFVFDEMDDDESLGLTHKLGPKDMGQLVREALHINEQTERISTRKRRQWFEKIHFEVQCKMADGIKKIEIFEEILKRNPSNYSEGPSMEQINQAMRNYDDDRAKFADGSWETVRYKNHLEATKNEILDSEKPVPKFPNDSS